MKSIKLTLTLDNDVQRALEAEARAKGLSDKDLMRDLLTTHAMSYGYMPEERRNWLEMYRGLANDVAEHAKRLCERDGFSTDITARAVRAAQADEDWLNRYRKFIGSDDPFVKGNPDKTSLNQNIGYLVRIAVNGEVIKTPTGRPDTGTVAGLVIKSYSKLKKL